MTFYFNTKTNVIEITLQRLQLDEYMVYSHGPDLCRKADLRHAMANCFEALMGEVCCVVYSRELEPCLGY